MSEALSNGTACERPAEPAGAAPATAAAAVGTERSDPERSDGERSGVETAAAACSAQAAASLEVCFPSAPPACDARRADELADDALSPGAPAAVEELHETAAVGSPGAPTLPRLGGCGSRRGRRLIKKVDKPETLTPEQRLLLLDTWRRSGLPAGDFAALVGVSKYTLYGWKKKFEEEGPAGLMDRPRGGPRGRRLPELTKRTILMLKESNPNWGCQRISNMLLRGPALPAGPGAVAHVLHEAGYQLQETPTRPHADHVRSFERARPNQLWQTDLFTFVLKRQNRRVYLVAFLDDHSRFLVSFGLHASQSTALVLEVLRAGIAAYGAPEEVLTDNGSQYVTWRGESAFHKELKQRGIRQIVAAPRHPQTLGKIERFWGTLWRECVETAVFLDLADARARIGHFIDWYNFQRTHSGIDGLVQPTDSLGQRPTSCIPSKIAWLPTRWSWLAMVFPNRRSI